MNPKNTETMKKAVIFARVSSEGDRQSTTRQVEDLKLYAEQNNLSVENIYEEHISGAKKNNERPVLNECLSFCVENNIDILLLSELSRLGRCADEVLANVRFAKEQHLNIYFQKENIYIYDKDGKENPFLTIMIAVLSTCASIERENIYYRLQSGRAQYVKRNLAEKGKSGLGRKVGYRKSEEKKREEYKEDIKLLRQGYPYRKVAKITGHSESSIKRIKKEFSL